MEEQVAGLKEAGNGHHKAKRFAEAIAQYKEGIKLFKKATKEGTELPTDVLVALHKNVAACSLKLSNWGDVIEHCTSALEKSPGDVKALYRRALGYQGQGEKCPNPKEKIKFFKDGFLDVQKVTKLDRKNTAASNLARTLMIANKKLTTEMQSTAGISRDVLSRALEAKTEKERKSGVEQVAAFSQTGPGANELFRKGVAEKLAPLLSSEDPEVVSAVLHTYQNIGKVPARALALLKTLTTSPVDQQLIVLFKSTNVKVARGAVQLLSFMLEACSADELETLPIAPICKKTVNKILEYFISLLPHRAIIAECRDATIAAIVKNIDRSDVGKRFVDLGGVPNLLMVASCSKSPLSGELTNAEAGIAVSKEARMQVSVTLQKLYDATKSDTAQGGRKLPVPKGMRRRVQKPYEQLEKDCLLALQWSPDPIQNIPTIYTLTAIIQGVIELANGILDSDGVMAHILKMATSANLDCKCAAAEALSLAASDKKRSKGVMQQGFPILKKLYAKDLPDEVRVRALCGLCKMGSHGGNTSNLKTFADGAVINLAKKVRPFLIGDDKSVDIKKWAAEGLAFLTLDADVKEMIVGDKKICKVVRQLCSDGDPTVQFGLANMLVNCTNSYDIEEKSEEKEAMKKIGKYAGEHIPEAHELDAEEYAKVRIAKLVVKHKMCEAMVTLGNTQSERAREQVARVLLAFSQEKEHRGTVLAAGGGKILVSLFNKNTDKGKLKAAHALAKLAITADPSIAFAGQRAAELVRPLVKLIGEDGGLERFEGCMALTNLAVMSDDLRMRVVREKGINKLEDGMFDDDPMIRRAATECMCNMMYCPKVYDMYATPEGACWERIKLWILLQGVGNEDVATAVAAGGGMCVLSESEEVCKRILSEKQGMTILRENAACGIEALQHRALYVMRNVAACKPEYAKEVAANLGLELFGALHEVSDKTKIRELCREVLDVLVKQGVIDDVQGAIDKARACSAETLQALQREEEESESEEEEEADTTDPDFASKAAWPGAKPYTPDDGDEIQTRARQLQEQAEREERWKQTRVNPEDLPSKAELAAIAKADEDHEVQQQKAAETAGQAQPAVGDVSFGAPVIEPLDVEVSKKGSGDAGLETAGGGSADGGDGGDSAGAEGGTPVVDEGKVEVEPAKVEEVPDDGYLEVGADAGSSA